MQNDIHRNEVHLVGRLAAPAVAPDLAHELILVGVVGC
jgi:hypothetical protein